jgi:tetratricopeptide (TPR) repeat protein
MRALLPGFLILVLLLWGCPAEESVTDDLASARKAYTIGHFSEAERIYQHYLQDKPEGEHRKEAWNRIIEISLSIYGDYEKAANLLDSMYFEYGDDPEQAWKLLNRLAEVYESMRDWDDAIKVWRRALNSPGLTQERMGTAYQRIAKIYSYQRNYTMAQEALAACEKQASDPDIKAACLYQSAQTLEFMLQSTQAQMTGGTDEKEESSDITAIQENIKSILARIDGLDGVDEERRAMATFLLADIMEAQGKRKDALQLFQSIQETYPNPKVVEARIEHLTKK